MWVGGWVGRAEEPSPPPPPPAALVTVSRSNFPVDGVDSQQRTRRILSAVDCPNNYDGQHTHTHTHIS